MALKAKLTMPPTLAKMLDDLAALEASGIDDAAREMLDAGADVMLEGMDKRVPVDKGDLKAHLSRGPVEQDGNLHSVEVGIRNAPKKIVVYGTVQEYGSVSVPAQSYIRETIAKDKGKIYRAMRRVLERIFGGK